MWYYPCLSTSWYLHIMVCTLPGLPPLEDAGDQDIDGLQIRRPWNWDDVIIPTY